MECLCAEVLTFGVCDKPLLYKISHELEGVLLSGMLVRVPLGKTTTFGIILKVRSADDAQSKFRLREISGIECDNSLIGQDLIDLISWMGRYYAAPHRALLEAVVPSVVWKNIRPKLIAKFSLIKTLGAGECEILRKRSPKQCAIYEFLLESTVPASKADLGKFSKSALSSLILNGIVGEEFEKANRVPCDQKSFSHGRGNVEKIDLTNEQVHAAENIIKSLDSGKFGVHLLHGITGSGKTEIYLEVIRKAVACGGDVIYLVPELALTPQTVSRIRRGLELRPEEVVVWHSGLSSGERKDSWLAMANGEAKVAIGARSAVFAPLKNVKVFVVDEEHEGTYKQDEMPRYHARDVAVYRAKLCGAVCILGSATPSVESLFNASSGKYKLNTLANRVDGSALPKIEVVDMRCERCHGAKKIISARLEELLANRLSKKEQVILFLNRRGYASAVFCNDCDYVATCPHCSTSLAYHRNRNLLQCHICGHEEALPAKCPRCGSHKILQSGVGTQKLASVACEMFPGARVERFDSDTTAAKDGLRGILDRFGMGKIDILVGTQMVAKGLDFPNVSLVGVVDVDGAMNFPDFRANERVFQSLIQVAGRAGRGTKPGIVVIQTRCPSAELIRLAAENDCGKFLKDELAARSEFFYPPFSHIIRLIFSGKNETKVSYFSKNVADALKRCSQATFDVRGPAPAVIQKVSDRFRFSAMCFAKNVFHALEKIHESLSSFQRTRDVAVTIDVDPVDMM
ncbi:MAG: primosomal protein N' [Puniceicoccales bacterium]|jgi:primosomal protein N' (replication factor Y)|nr:primosomal protein N' [Puniceicoccales bacterium]